MRKPQLLEKANLEACRKLLLSTFDAIHVDTKETKGGVGAMQPKAPFRPVCSVATTRENSGVLTLKQPPEKDSEDGPCSWWRRGREPVSELNAETYALSSHVEK